MPVSVSLSNWPTSMSAHCLVLLLFLMPQTGHGATVYRVGGNAGSSDIHLSWTELATGFGGDWKSLNMDERIEPIFLKPDRNFALEALDGGRPPLVRKQTINFLAWVSDPIVNSTVDGDKTTGFAEDYLIAERQFPRFLFDLGGRFPINRGVFYPRPEHQDRFVENFRVYVFDGDPRLLDGGNFLVQWNQTVPEIPEVELVHEAERNRSPRVDVTLPLRQSTHLILDIGDPGASFKDGQFFIDRHSRSGLQPWEIAEFEIYGDGYTQEARYTSQILDLGSTAILGDLRWVGSQDGGARVRIRTRSGSDDDPTRYWRRTGRSDEITFRNDAGGPLTRSDYEGMTVIEQGGTTHDVDSWSFWSSPYVFGDSAGTAIVSPSPNRYLQLDVLFENAGRDGGELSWLEFEMTSPPVVQQAVGEVWPVETKAGEETAFVYAFKPRFTPISDPVESGFDQIALSTPGEMIAVDSVRVNEDVVAYEVSDGPLPGSRVGVRLPRMEAEDSGKVVEVFFRARVFHFGTRFEGRLFDSDRPGEVGQLVTDGDATFRLDSNRLSVGVDLAADLLQEVGVTSPVVTPNGDGVNDEVGFRYVLMKLTEARVTIDIYDLSGRRVQRVYEGVDSSGRHEVPWDGRGEAGSLAPGAYVFRVAVSVNADSRNSAESGVISVVY